MITGLTFRNFKCFESAELPLGGLTLLAGQNGMGKSTVLQSLLLLKQSSDAQTLGREGLLLNGPLVQVGTADSLLFDRAPVEEISLGFSSSEGTFRWDFGYPGRSADMLPLLRGPTERTPLEALHLQYLSAERLGPRVIHESSADAVDRRGTLGPDGRYTIAYLLGHERDEVLGPMRHPNAASSGLKSNVEAWLSEVSPGAELRPQAHVDINRASLRVRFPGPDDPGGEYVATSVGFGVSYVLPVLVGVLCARAGDLVLVENPEAHLHPKGQFAVGQLVARAATSGVQLLVETHSDHALNGVRLAVKKGDARAEQVALYFFDRQIAQGRPVLRIQSPRIDSDGRIDVWPSGFFDQWEASLDALLQP